MTHTHRQLGIFAKYWEPGSVKTRLAAAIGPEAAAELQLAFTQELLHRFGDFPAERVVAYSPLERRAEFAPLAGAAWRLEPQGSGDLGMRIDHFFSSGFARGHRKIVLIGSDSPTLPRTLIDQAFDVLDHADVVLGPSDDGGYYLIGARDRVPPVSVGIPWSTPQVLAATITRLDAVPLRHVLLPAWYDVDHIVDLRRLAGEIRDEESELATLVKRIASAGHI